MDRILLLILFLLYSSRNAVVTSQKLPVGTDILIGSKSSPSSKETLEAAVSKAVPRMKRILDNLLAVHNAQKVEPQPLPGYDEYTGVGQYKFHSELLTWNEARKACIAEGGHLAVINSWKEAKTLVKIFKTEAEKTDTRKDFMYLGFHDMFQEGEFVTVLGEALKDTGYEQWREGEPNNRAKYTNPEDCGSMDTDGLLNDISCTKDKVPFICENS